MSRAPDRIGSALQAAGPDLLRYLLRRTSDPEVAADLVGEVALVAWRRRRDAPRVDAEVRLWLFGIARHAIRNHWRATARATRLAERLRLEAGRLVDAPDPAQRTSEIDEVAGLLARLPDDDAELLRLVHWDGLTLNDAATVIGVPASTVRSRYSTAKRRLRELALPSTQASSDGGSGRR